MAKSAGVVRVIVGDESGQRGGASQGSGYGWQGVLSGQIGQGSQGVKMF